MHQRDRRADALVGQVRVELAELVGRQHALVGDGAHRQRRQVELDAALAGLPLGLLAHAVDDPLEVEAGEHVAGRVEALGAHEHLDDPGHRGERGRAEVGGVGRHVPPAEHLRALDQRVLLQDPHRALGAGRVGRQERQAGRVGARRGQREVDDRAEERVRDLDHDAGAVAGVGLGAAGAPMVHPAERRQALADHIMGSPAVEVGDEGDPTRVMLEGRVVEPLRLRSGVTHRAS